MWEKPHIQNLHGNRLHMQHGPIDVVLRAWGSEKSVAVAYEAAWNRFDGLLGELTGELDELRLPMSERPLASTSVGLRMIRACDPFPEHFITPMAAVAGAVADELIAVMTAAADLDRAYVNDGGDIAVHLANGQSLTIAMMEDVSTGLVLEHSGSIPISAASDIRGIATSGARGRSFSLGISDSVTVLSCNAAIADAAATLIANGVNLDHADIVRRPAWDIEPDNDLRDRPVTVSVPKLSSDEIAIALNHGLDIAREFRSRGLIIDAALSLQGQTITLGNMLQLQGKTN